MKIIFFGSDQFAKVHLEALFQSSHQVLACVTPPDKPKGRGMKVSFSEVKDFGLRHSIPVYQPDDIGQEEFLEILKNLNADIYIVIAYGRKLPDTVLRIPSQGALNVHASLLPKYRGAAPINWAVIKGEARTGLSLFRLNNKMDGGDILAQKVIDIAYDDTAVSLRQKMMAMGPDFLLETLIHYAQGPIQFLRQDESEASSAPKLKKELGQIQWDHNAKDIRDLVRGLLPWPTAYTYYNKMQLKILSAEITEKEGGPPGTVLEADKQGIVAATGNKALVLKEVHLQSAKPMTAYQFIIGHRLKKGDRLG